MVKHFKGLLWFQTVFTHLEKPSLNTENFSMFRTYVAQYKTSAKQPAISINFTLLSYMQGRNKESLQFELFVHI